MKRAWKPTALTQPNNPPKPGVYERQLACVLGGTTVFQHWNGEYWGKWTPNVEHAMDFSTQRSEEQGGLWRELPVEESVKGSFEDAATPLIRWLNANGPPHMTVIVDQTHAELLEGQKSFVTHVHVRD